MNLIQKKFLGANVGGVQKSWPTKFRSLSRYVSNLRWETEDHVEILKEHTEHFIALHYAAEVCQPSALASGFRAPESSLTKSLENLTATLRKHHDKIFYLQISDAIRVDVEELAAKARQQKIHPLYAWSNEFRPLPFQDEYKGFLPVMNVISAILNTGWRGPWSYEVRNF